MDTAQIRKVVDWMKGTDLVEVAYKKGSAGFALTTPGAPATEPAIPASRFVPVASPAVGVLQWNAPGKPRKTEEGADVAEGDVLAVISVGKSSEKIVKAPCAGRVVKLLAEAGDAVDYGRAIAILEPKA